MKRWICSRRVCASTAELARSSQSTCPRKGSNAAQVRAPLAARGASLFVCAHVVVRGARRALEAMLRDHVKVRILLGGDHVVDDSARRHLVDAPAALEEAHVGALLHDDVDQLKAVRFAALLAARVLDACLLYTSPSPRDS